MKKKGMGVATLILVLMLVLGLGCVITASADNAGATDPTFAIVGSAGTGDGGKVNSDGTVRLDLTPSVGYGCRAVSSKLGAGSQYDVKNFSATISFDNVPTNIATMFSLQTTPTGTIGAGNGNGINILLRADPSNQIAVAIYDQKEQPYWAPGSFTLADNKEITITFNYDGGTPIVISSGDKSFSAPASVVPQKAFDDHYASDGYKGYISISSYYMILPQTFKAQYTLKLANGKTPVAQYAQAVEAAVTAFVAKANVLSDSSAQTEIDAANLLNIFGVDSSYAALLPIVDTDGALSATLNPALDKLTKINQKNLYIAIKNQIALFKTALDNFTAGDNATVKAALDAYEAINIAELKTLHNSYKTELESALAQLTDSEKFKSIVKIKTDNYIKVFEQILDGDVQSYQAYKELLVAVKNWDSYKSENYVSDALSAADVTILDARIKAVGVAAEDSFYSGLWREGDSWNAELYKKGLYVTGKGAYDETIGFNQKMEINKNAEVVFNVIYALKKLGANHLHIGFYPIMETGTRGDSDGVRVDFWFSALNEIEVKPVNGKTEEPLFESAYLSVPDTGFFDNDAAGPDYSIGQYTVGLTSDENVLTLSVNGNEMQLDGLNADLFRNGCYVTVSAMSAENADNNELLFTKIGGVSYIDYKKTEVSNKVEKHGCCNAMLGGGVTNVLAMSIIFVSTGVVLFVFVKRKKKC